MMNVSLLSIWKAHQTQQKRHHNEQVRTYSASPPVSRVGHTCSNAHRQILICSGVPISRVRKYVCWDGTAIWASWSCVIWFGHRVLSEKRVRGDSLSKRNAQQIPKETKTRETRRSNTNTRKLRWRVAWEFFTFRNQIIIDRRVRKMSNSLWLLIQQLSVSFHAQQEHTGIRYKLWYSAC